jgi:alpha-D-ribose 1-methylphosphonate 5-triphosphate synthase subunit PhnH
MTLDAPGFADPVIEAQSCFRAVLEAMARPGSLPVIASVLATPPLDQATAPVLLTLADAATPVWLAGETASAWDWLAFHSGAPRAASIELAGFVCATEMPRLDSLEAGSDAAPETAATLILQLPALEGGTPLILYGPGLEAPVRFAPQGLPEDFVAQWAANHRLFPRGIDLILCSGDRLCGLPRSLRIGAA